MAKQNRYSSLIFLGAIAVFGLVFIWFFRGPKSEILISDRMSDFVELVNSTNAKEHEKLVVFDIDDTIYQSSKLLGTPTWFYNMVNKVRQEGAEKHEAYEIMGTMDRTIQEHVEVRKIEESTIYAINQWQKNGAIVVALTSRPKKFIDTTTKQLASVGVSMNHPMFSCIETKWDQEMGGFKNGIMFVGDKLSKSQVFSQFFELAKRCGHKPALISFADDQERYVSQIQNYSEQEGVPYIGIIYGAALKSRDFDLKKANRELHELEKKLGLSVIPDQYKSAFLVD